MTAEALRALAHIPLAEAYLCMDCRAVGNLATQCPACASTAVLSLAQVLDGRPRPVTEEWNGVLV
jgi:hypothetical protein